MQPAGALANQRTCADRPSASADQHDAKGVDLFPLLFEDGVDKGLLLESHCCGVTLHFPNQPPSNPGAEQRGLPL
jgi:hypothetical protein